MTVLEIRDLQKSFRAPDGSEQSVLDIQSFELEDRQHLALEGGSGSGKTTLLHIIAGILRPDSGRVRVDGTEVTTLSEASRDAFRARAIGYVFQTFNLLQGYTALENVLLAMMFGRGADPALARDLLGELGLGDRLDYRPRQLSIGQQQRVAVARALANEPRLVLADEPTGNLDARRAHDALALLRRSCEQHGAALLLVSHDRSVLDGFDHTVKLVDINQAMVGEEAP